jgi:hypothetical protein
MHVTRLFCPPLNPLLPHGEKGEFGRPEAQNERRNAGASPKNLPLSAEMPWVRAPPARSGQTGTTTYPGDALSARASGAQRADRDNRVPWRCPECARLRRAAGRPGQPRTPEMP